MWVDSAGTFLQIDKKLQAIFISLNTPQLQLSSMLQLPNGLALPANFFSEGRVPNALQHHLFEKARAPCKQTDAGCKANDLSPPT